ncbi:MAG: hypothetical protein ABI537_01690 [Casimicrobiaceae bacterium]
MTDIPDPRVFEASGDARHAPLLSLAAASMAAPTAARADALDRELAVALAGLLRDDAGAKLAGLFPAAPTVAVARQLRRRLIEAWSEASRADSSDGISPTLFALPVVIVVGGLGGAEIPPLASVLAHPDRIAQLLREHGALGGNQNFALSNALAAADAIDVAQLPGLLRWQQRALAGALEARDLPPAPITAQSGQESVHLRFLLGAAFAAPGIDLLARSNTAGWSMPLAQELGRQLARPDMTVLALPRAPAPPPMALAHGRSAQREVGAQLFASNAIRRLRASVGEPSAVISAHRCPSAPGGGELRLSLSSVFDPRQAEGFRCPLYPGETAGEVATMLGDLLHDCRVTDVRVLQGVHADRDPATNLTLLFKTDALPASVASALH